MKIIIAGCGRMGAGLIRKLSMAGHFITVIDSDPSSFELLGPSVRAQTITGMGFDRDVLMQAKIDRTEALAAVTSSDEANIIIARLAREVFHVPRVIARLCDLNKAEIYQRLGIQTIDPTTWGINRVNDLFCSSPLENLQSIGSGAVDIVKIEIPASLNGRKALELSVPGEFQVIAISNTDKTYMPTPDTELQEKDIVHLAVAASSGDRLKDLLGLA